MMNVAHILSACEDRTSGPKNSVTLLSKSLSGAGVKSDVYSISIEREFSYNGVLVRPFRKNIIGSYDFFIFSGVYHAAYPAISGLILKSGKFYAISPRSSFIKKSIKKSRIKKNIFMNFYARKFIKKSSFIHYLSDEEAENSIDLECRPFVCPNIVEGIPFGFDAKKERLIGYVGRYDIHHKGLDRFIQAVKLSADGLRGCGYRVILHGTDFDKGKGYLEDYVQRNNLGDLVSIEGPVFGEEKNSFLKRVSIFVHASRYEGQPQAVMEAMAQGCAIAVTTGTNMQGVVQGSGCGILIGETTEEMSRDLLRLAVDSEFVNESGRNAYDYACNNFSSDEVANKMSKFLRNFTKD